MNEQWTSRNQRELLDILSTFREVSEMCDENYILNLELHYWELYDLRICEPIMRFKYKDALTFLSQLKHLKHSIINVCMIKYNRDKRPNRTQVWALKYLKKFYNNIQIQYFL